MRNLSFVAGVVALASLAAQVAPARVPADERPLLIEGASPAIVRAALEGPRFHAPEIFAAFEDYHNPRVSRLREEYGLAGVVAGEPQEFRRQLKLRHWVHTRWPIDNNQNKGGDAFAILEMAKKGEGFHCSHSSTVQHAVMVAMGYVVRDLGVDRNHEDLGRSTHHGVNEVWSNEHAKWVLLDAKYDIHFERDGVPLSALELHEAVGPTAAKASPDAARHRAPAGRHGFGRGTGSDGALILVGVLLPASHPLHRAALERREPAAVFDDEAFRNTTWYRSEDENKLVKHWAYAAQAFIPVRDRHEIDWTPGVPDLQARQSGAAELEIRFRSATPNFKGYLTRVNGGPWAALAGDRTRWTLRTGQNRLDVRTRNLAGVDGPIASALVEFKP